MYKAKLSKKFRWTVLTLAIIFGISLAWLPLIRGSAAAGLSINIIAAPNLIVDSNVLSPSSYQPIVATVIGEVCNTGSPGEGDITDVYAYIGDYINGGTSTPAVYPVNTPGTISGGGVSTTYYGSYSFTHLGSSTDAARYIGTLSPGECSYQYWSFSYPKTAIEDNGGSPGAVIPASGTSVKPGDDLFLNFDIWASGYNTDTSSTQTVDATHKMTLRNQISAMANKIEPNGNPGGAWFNTDTSTVFPGDTVTTNGILYRLGNVNQGFDNNNDGVPDYNAWLQPFGDPSYDPDCFRLIQTTGVLTITTNSGDVIIPFKDSLYFSDLPTNNTNVVGLVYYKFLALGGACNIPITPYQEVASGADNEKFNGDYGAGPEPTGSYEPAVTVDKSGSTTVIEPGNISYSITFANTSTEAAAGLTLSSGGIDMPLLVEDFVPDGLQYRCDAVVALNYTPASSPETTIYYSTNSGSTWSTVQPALCTDADAGTFPTSTGPDNLIGLRFVLNDPMPVATTTPAFTPTATATFNAGVPSGYAGADFIENCASGKFGADGTPFAEDCTITIVEGGNSIGDYVFYDQNGNGLWDEDNSGTLTAGDDPGINEITVWLYWDKTGNGLTADDVLIATTETANNGSNDGAYLFDNLPDGSYVVKVDITDPDLDDSSNGGSTGITPTTPKEYEVALAGGTFYDDADFGFGPTLIINKTLISTDPAFVANDPAYSGENVTFLIDLSNSLPGDGTANGFCQYKIYPTIVNSSAGDPPSGTGIKAWSATSSILGPPDHLYAYTDMEDANETIGLSGFTLGPQSGEITKVEVLIQFSERENFITNSKFNVRVWDDVSGILALYPFDHTYFSGPAGTAYTIRQDVTSARASWDWSHFAGNTTEMQLEADKGSGSDGGEAAVDAAAYLVTTDELCGGADSTITLLPLQDQYDADILKFLYSEPPVSSSSLSGSDPNTVGTLQWDNLGPLYAGGTRYITVTFQAIATTPATINTATSTNGKFGNERTVNTATDNDTVGVNTSGSISGNVWADTNDTVGNSGWVGTTGYGSGDSFIPGVTVNLYVCADLDTQLAFDPGDPSLSLNKDCENSANDGVWLLVASTTTDANGDYSFVGLRDGFYNVEIEATTLPPGFDIAASQIAEPDPDQSPTNGFTCGTCDWLWNSLTANLDTFNTIDNSGGADNITNVNFGYEDDTDANGAVIGYVWDDHDGDGIWDEGEMPLAGVTVYLCTEAAGTPCDSSNALTSVTTDANGRYVFGNVTPGNYRTGVETADVPGMSQSGDPDDGAVTCTTCDNQTTTVFSVAASQVVSTNGSGNPLNFGYTGGLTIGDTIFTDWNGDGVQGDGDSYDLSDEGDAGIAGVVVYLYRDQDGDGVYDSGSDTLLDSTTTMGYNVVDGYIDLDGDGFANESDEDLADLQGIAVIDGALDMNGDGLIDAGDSGTFAGFNVYAGRLDMDNDGDGDGADDGDLNGRYQFTGLAGNGTDYIVVVSESTLPSGYQQTADPEGGCPAGSTCDGRDFVDLQSSNYGDADFGYQPSGFGVIGDYVWFDDDGDGVADANEQGVAGTAVNLYHDSNGDGIIDANDALVASTTTLGYSVIDGYIDIDGGGISASDDLADLYGYAVIDGAIDINGDGFIGDGTTYPADNGSFGPYTVINGRLDLNDSGASDGSDDGDLVGFYLFDGLADGDYIVQVAPAAFSGGNLDGYSMTTTGTGYNDDQNSRAVAISGGNEYYEADFGFATTAIGDYIWQDNDGDGIADLNERGIPKVVVELYEDTDNDGDLDTLVTSTETFYNVIDGALDVDGDGAITAADDGSLNGVAIIDGLLDLDGGGISTTDDGKFAGYTVIDGYLDMDGDGITGADSGDDNDLLGKYLFTGLPAGNYVVKVADSNFDPGGALYTYVQSADPDVYNTLDPVSISCLDAGAVGCDNLKAFDRYDAASSLDENPAIRPGVIDLSADFGYKPQATVGDQLWIDTDGDGIKDIDERGLQDITVRLCADAACTSVVATTTTDENGEYSFGGSDLADDTTYYISVLTADLPAGLTQTYDPLTGNNCNSGTCLSTVQVTIDYDRTTGSVASIGGQACPVDQDCDLDVDFGYRFEGTNQISGVAWYDSDASGVDANGVGIIATDGSEDYRYTGVPVYLWNCGADATCGTADDLLVGSTTTLDVDVVDGYIDLDGDGIANESDEDGTLQGVALIDGALDMNGDGLIDANDTGTFVGYTVINGRLDMDNDAGIDADDDGSLDGRYQFSDLADGTYRVVANPNAFSVRDTSITTPSSYDTSNGLEVTFSGGSGSEVRDFGFRSTMDFGDLPENYAGSLLAVNGARHTLPSGNRIYLGNSVDVDPNGQEDAQALGDDNDGLDDDDGVAPLTGSWKNGVDGGSIAVTVGSDQAGACLTGCYVSAWIDWNGDGAFSSSERVLVDAMVVNGTQTLTFDIPDGTINGSTTLLNVRVRLYPTSTFGSASPFGLVNNGEVEDYQWSLGPTAVTLTGLAARLGHTPGWAVAAAVVLLLGTMLAFISVRRQKAGLAVRK